MVEMGGSPTTRCTDATGQGRGPGGTNWTHLSILRTSWPALIHRSLHAHSAMRRTIPQRIVRWLHPNPRLKEHLAGAFHRADHSLPASPSASPPTVLRPLSHPGEWPFAPHGTAGGVPFRGHATSGTHAFPDRVFAAYLLRGIEYGFRIGVPAEFKGRHAKRNLRSAYDHGAIVQEYLKREETLERIKQVQPCSRAGKKIPDQPVWSNPKKEPSEQVAPHYRSLFPAR